jgi:hypothetical protein
MSAIDSEIHALRARIKALEEQKAIRVEKAEKESVFPLKTLGDIIQEKKMQIERNSYSKSVPLAGFYDREKVAFLEPIFNMLIDIQKRLEVLENA